MFKTKEKIVARIQELSNYRYKSQILLKSFLCMEDEGKDVSPILPILKIGNDIMEVGERWSGRDRYLWLQKDISIPSEWQHSTIVGLFDFGKTGDGHNSGFESLLYIDEVPYQGVDSNHQEVFFKNEWCGKNVRLTFRLWSGLEGGGEQKEQEHQIKRAEVAVLDEQVDDFYYTAKVILETIELLDDSDVEKIELLSTLNKSFQYIEWSLPGSEQFYESIYTANDYLQQKIDAMEKHSLINITCIGHTHIDVAWLWRLKHTREKAARSFSTVLRLMEKYPDYVFLQTQPQLYEYIKNDYPEIYEQIKERIAEGRWEVDGAMWLEADCNMPSGESLVRQILVGSRFIKEEFDKEVEYLWLPDVFGYSWALPQILKKSGIDTFMTTKISWNQYNRIPHDTFHWRGIDGSEVLAHFITTPEPNSQPFITKHFSTYNGLIQPQTVKGAWDKYQDKTVNQDLLLSYGYGDGGGGVNREMLEYRRRIDKLPSMPNVKTGTAREYFRKLQETVNNTTEYVHTWDGELYLEYHRGTYTSQAYNKKMNRKLELLYRQVEWLNAWNCLENNTWQEYPSELLLEGWKIILRNQFHDIIPGSSISEVYADSKIEYTEAEKIANIVKTTAQQSIVNEKANKWTVLNDANWKRSEVVNIAMDTKEGSWVDEEGNTLLAQPYADGWKVQVDDIPAMGWKTVIFRDAAKQDANSTAFIAGENKVDTPHYVIAWNNQGQLVSIFDKEAGREVLVEGQKGNVLQVFEDKPLNFEAWDIDIFYQEKMNEITNLQEVKLIESGPVEAVVKFRWNYQNSIIEQDMVVYKNSKRIDFKTKVDWHEKQQLLKVAFPVDVRSTEATYQIQYGNAKRPTHWNTSWDLARFESVGHQWADVSERNYGVALLNDCKYGYDIKDNIMRLSLIKSAIYPDPEQDQGEHEFTYALLPHQGDFVSGNVEQEAWALNQPLLNMSGEVAMEHHSLFEVDNSYVVIDAVKKAEDSNGIIIRFHEYSGSTQTVNISSPYHVARWKECNLMEKAITEWNDSEIVLHVKPYEVKTIVVDMEKRKK